MEISAVFEAWHLADGNYPPFEKGQLVNLSFEIQPDEIILTAGAAPSRFHHSPAKLEDEAGLWHLSIGPKAPSPRCPRVRRQIDKITTALHGATPGSYSEVHIPYL